MRKLPRIIDAQPLIQGVLRVVFDDDCEGVDDLQPLTAERKVFAWPSAPAHFAAVRVDEFRQSVSWLDDKGYSVALSADSLYRDATRQAEMHRLMVS